MPLQELAKDTLRPTPIARGPHQDLDHVAVLIHGTPQILPLSVDAHEHFVPEPRVTETTLRYLESPCVFRTELLGPASDGLLRHHDSPFGKHILDISEAEAEFIVEPD